jgi:transposase
MVNKELNHMVLANLTDTVHRKRHELWGNQTWILHHENAPDHTSLLIRTFPAKHKISVVPHLPYSLDLAQAECFLFPKIKTTLKGRRFQTIEEIKENFTNPTKS